MTALPDKILVYRNPDISAKYGRDGGEWVVCEVENERGHPIYSSQSLLVEAEKELEESRDEITAKDTALGIDKVQILEEMHRMEGEITAANERAERAEKRSRFNKDNHLAAEEEVDRLRDLLREKPERDMDALIAAFCMVYTSPAWGGDERSPEGWEKKEAALRKAFASASANRRSVTGWRAMNKNLLDAIKGALFILALALLGTSIIVLRWPL